jgi:hypothetical protein
MARGVLGDLLVQELDAAGQGAQASGAGSDLEVPVVRWQSRPQVLTRRGVTTSLDLGVINGLPEIY